MSNKSHDDLINEVVDATEALEGSRLRLQALRIMITGAKTLSFGWLWGEKAAAEQLAFLEEGLPGHLEGIKLAEERLARAKADLAAGKSSYPNTFELLLGPPQKTGIS